MDSEIIIEDDNDDNDNNNNHEESIPTTPVLKSNENKNVKVASNTCEKKKKKACLIYSGYLILNSDHFYESTNRIQLKLFALPAMNIFQSIMVERMILIGI